MKLIKNGSEARAAVKRGIDIVADIVKATMGARGRNVLLGSKITNDGVSIAKDIELEDEFENVGATLVKEVADKTNESAGDGTTTSIVLAQALATEGLKYVETGISPVMLREGMELAKDAVIQELKKNAKKISTKEAAIQVATISAENEEMGKLVGETVFEVGEKGVITVEEAPSFGFSKEVVNGMKLDKGFISPHFITDKSGQKAEVKKPLILITDKKISSVPEILPLLEKIATSGKKEIVIIAEEVEGEALATLIVNKMQGRLNPLALRAPDYGSWKTETLEDIAAITGGKVIGDTRKLESVELSDLGESDKVVANRDTATIIGGKGTEKDIASRLKTIQGQINSAANKWEAEKTKSRLAKMTGGVAVIRVGAASETELGYLKHKLEDAINATQAAMEEGVVAGGGTALLKAQQAVKYPMMNSEKKAGFDIVLKACEAPIFQIVKNAGKKNESVVVERVLEEKNKNFGYDARSGLWVGDMINVGIIDPVKVSRTALENAVSTISMLLTTEAVVVDRKEQPHERRDN